MRRRGVDVMTVTEAGMCGRNDEAQLAFALNTGRVIVTQDRDFFDWLRAEYPMPALSTRRKGADQRDSEQSATDLQCTLG
jgi:predicted nuclease of predicted toxin-antitoxin system